MTEGRPPTAGSAPLWERDAEIATVAQALDVLCADQTSAGSLLVLRGEAGLGKTALLAETRRIAERRGCAVWSARGAETLRSVPFHVVRQLLQPALLSLLPEEAREYLGDWYDIAGPALGIADPQEGSADPQYVCDGLVAAVRRLARREWPLVLLLDDAHWADQETLRWLAAFVERLDDVSVLVVVTRRPGEVSGDGARLLDTVAEAAGRSVNNLSALTPDATAGLTRATLGRHADDAFCREVWAVTGGNPYDTVELLAKVQDSELQPVEAQAGELRALNRAARGGGLVDRLKGLGLEATRFAWAAAILGTGITVDMVARLATMNDDLAGHCAELLCNARILTEPDPAGGTERGDVELEFVHPLIATAVYNSIPPGVCTAMHGVAAQIITELGRGAAEAARHLLKVHPDDDEELVEQLREAAREHLAVGAPDAARRCLERALEEPPRPEVHAHVLYELGCATLLTNPAVTIDQLQSALGMRGLDVDDRVDAVVRLSQALLHNDQLEEAVRTVEAEAARHEAGPVRMRLQAFQFMWEGIHGETVSPARSRRLAELASTCAGRDNAERALLILRGFDAMTHGESADVVIELCDRALVNGRLAPGLGWTDPEWGMELLMMLGSAYAYADRLDRAESLFAEARRVYTTAGWRGGHLSLANAFLGLAYRRQGRLRDAESTLREGLVLAEQYGFAPPYPSTIVLPDIRSVRGRLLLAVGRTEEGVNELEAAEKTAGSRGGHNPVLAPWSIDLAKALAGQDPARAAQLAADARRQAERFGTDTAIGEALRCAAALETGQRAVQLAARAVTYLEASPCQYEHAAARVEYGIAARSIAELNRGLDLARACGAEGLVTQAREVLETGRGLH
ncbi:ATP-binding protein [Streptomyces echinatus]|uniref:ATP-binding protein n=1 Tax=Streptomyces echinatus TaxID=67293 RepID=UPI00381119BB